MNIKILIILGALNVCKHVTLRMILSEQVNVTGFCNTYYICTVRLEKLFPFCYHCTFLKRCDRLRSVPFYYRSLFRLITVLRFVSFAACT